MCLHFITVILQNVVVVSQPAPSVLVPEPPKVHDYFDLSVITLVLCILCGGLPFALCAGIAIGFSLKVRRGLGGKSVLFCVGGLPTRLLWEVVGATLSMGWQVMPPMSFNMIGMYVDNILWGILGSDTLWEVVCK